MDNSDINACWPGIAEHQNTEIVKLHDKIKQQCGLIEAVYEIILQLEFPTNEHMNMRSCRLCGAQGNFQAVSENKVSHMPWCKIKEWKSAIASSGTLSKSTSTNSSG